MSTRSLWVLSAFIFLGVLFLNRTFIQGVNQSPEVYSSFVKSKSEFWLPKPAPPKKSTRWGLCECSCMSADNAPLCEAQKSTTCSEQIHYSEVTLSGECSQVERRSCAGFQMGVSQSGRFDCTWSHSKLADSNEIYF